jgi:hypothetical protein
MKFQIVRDISVERLASHVRPAFRGLIPAPRSKTEIFALILFRFQHDEKGSGVIISSAAEQALARLGNVQGQRTLALGGDFTLEAKALLRQNGVEPVGLRDFGWTDESYLNIKNSY